VLAAITHVAHGRLQARALRSADADVALWRTAYAELAGPIR
jgi:hypothetical protein